MRTRFLPLLLLFLHGPAWAALPAFPGAVGQGAANRGGRGGDVYHVTSLEDYDSDNDEQKIPGTLRHALRSPTGPRTIVFDVSGPIALKCPLAVRKDHLTIAGQTSPGGVTLWGYPVNVSNCTDVVIRHLRVRLGDFHAAHKATQEGSNAAPGNHDLQASTANAVAVYDAERVLLDHLSVSWGMDETLSVTRSRDVTVQNCLIAESLRDSYHAKGQHGYGSLVRGELTEEDREANRGGYTFFRNLWAHHDARNPSIGGQQKLDRGQQEEDRRSTDVNLVNCIVYNWGSRATHRSNDGLVRLNLLDNYYQNGPARDAEFFFYGTKTGPTLVRHRGNLHYQRPQKGQPRQRVEPDKKAPLGFGGMNKTDEVKPAEPPFGFCGDLERRTAPAEQAYEEVLRTAGASLWRDAVDQRIVGTVRSGGGRLIDSQEEFRVGGQLPGIDDLQSQSRPADFDTDQDGMPDQYEAAQGLSPSDPDDRNEVTSSSDGFTNLEVYLNSLTAPASGQ